MHLTNTGAVRSMTTLVNATASLPAFPAAVFDMPVLGEAGVVGAGAVPWPGAAVLHPRGCYRLPCAAAMACSNRQEW
jgi:hypothetical protein